MKAHKVENRQTLSLPSKSQYLTNNWKVKIKNYSFIEIDIRRLF